MIKKTDNYDFEGALQELENLVERMEAGALTLEESMQAFERGIKLTRECQTMLSKAEQKVNHLVEEQGKTLLTPFAQPEEEGQD